MNKPSDAHIHYDDIANYVYERLARRGYVPAGDEFLDTVDIVFDFAIIALQCAGVTVHVLKPPEPDTL